MRKKGGRKEIAAESRDPDRRTHLETCTGRRSERRKRRKLFFRDFHSPPPPLPPIEPSKPAPKRWMDRQTPSAAMAVRRFFPSPSLTSKLPLMYAGQENQQCQRKREREWGGEGKRKIGLNWSLMAVERREREREKNGRLSTTMAGCFWWEWKNLRFFPLFTAA